MQSHKSKVNNDLRKEKGNKILRTNTNDNNENRDKIENAFHIYVA